MGRTRKIIKKLTYRLYGDKEVIMMYNMKYFNENAKKVDSEYSEIYDLDGHRIAIAQCERCARRQYYNVCVDGTTIATRTLLSNTIRLALNYLNGQ